MINMKMNRAEELNISIKDCEEHFMASFKVAQLRVLSGISESVKSALFFKGELKLGPGLRLKNSILMSSLQLWNLSWGSKGVLCCPWIMEQFFIVSKWVCCFIEWKELDSAQLTLISSRVDHHLDLWISAIWGYATWFFTVRSEPGAGFPDSTDSNWSQNVTHACTYSENLINVSWLPTVKGLIV